MEAKGSVEIIRKQAEKTTLVSGGSRSLDDFIEHLADWAHQRFGTDEFVKAREEFYWQTGKVFEQDPFFEERSNYFIDHFLFTRPVSHDGEGDWRGNTPFQTYLSELSKAGSRDSALSAFPEILSVAHSVFKIRRVSPDSLIVLDMIKRTKLKIWAKERQLMAGFKRNDIFQGYIFEVKNLGIFMSRGIFLHPANLGSSFRRLFRQCRKISDHDFISTLYQLAQFQVRTYRLPHVEPRKFINLSSPYRHPANS